MLLTEFDHLPLAPTGCEPARDFFGGLLGAAGVRCTWEFTEPTAPGTRGSVGHNLGKPY
ncbi:MAG TPA: hypothetical protein VEI55_02735 [Candidatus Acidoferrum sp.]|nr:hypothetical protein [Candidatus Acidoferrum sp.]